MQGGLFFKAVCSLVSRVWAGARLTAPTVGVLIVTLSTLQALRSIKTVLASLDSGQKEKGISECSNRDMVWS